MILSGFSQIDSLFVEDPKCPGDHALKSLKIPNHCQCDKCGKNLPKGSTMYGCRICNFDLCPNCTVTHLKIVFFSGYIVTLTGQKQKTP